MRSSRGRDIPWDSGVASGSARLAPTASLGGRTSSPAARAGEESHGESATATMQATGLRRR
jgi:hypothetical protein